jgi:hypothetical protein
VQQRDQLTAIVATLFEIGVRREQAAILRECLTAKNDGPEAE